MIGTLERGGTEGQLALLAEGALEGRLAGDVSACRPPVHSPVRSSGTGWRCRVAGFRGLTPLRNPMPLAGVRRFVVRSPTAIPTSSTRSCTGGTSSDPARLGVQECRYLRLVAPKSPKRSEGAPRARAVGAVLAPPVGRGLVCNGEAVRDDAVANGFSITACRVIRNGVAVPDRVAHAIPQLGHPDHRQPHLVQGASRSAGGVRQVGHQDPAVARAPAVAGRAGTERASPRVRRGAGDRRPGRVPRFSE